MRGRPAEGNRNGYWFPLALLGFLLLGGLGLDSVRTARDFGWFAYRPSGTYLISAEQYGAGVDSLSVRYFDYPAMAFDLWQYPSRDWPWQVIVIATFVVTVAWYGWRARRTGGASARPFVALAAGGGVAIAAAYVIAAWAAAVPKPSELVTSVALPLALLGGVAGAWAYFRLGPGRRAAAVISVVCLLVGAATLLGSQLPPLVDPVIITVGLLGLAWWERSVLLALVAVAVLAAMAAFPVGTLSALVPAMLLLVGAIAALVLRGRPAPGERDPAA
ncbi:MAG TPA: hypothetical protein VGX25_18535 [Actinophytocola sp.]|uniref:hypothetical protein n=1 Tax=Actinophytocola sp. TaxID=1872138 RepID=UPI002DDCE479|nr:hypothetical protein [Actinophytocola sp.]HEV2781384.1 hypothetical protein [Actinophytocola sp.]